MKFKSLNDKEINVSLRGKRFNGEDSKSKFQLTIGKKLLKQYKGDIIYTEIFIPIERLFLDFFIPNRRLVIEVDGVQHQRYVKFFHKTITEFNKQQDIDRRKSEWCKLNGLKLIKYGMFE